jgi:hypothetical protein
LRMAQYIPVGTVNFQSQDSLPLFIVRCNCERYSPCFQIIPPKWTFTTFSVLLLLLSEKFTLHGRVCLCLLQIH